MIISKSIHVAVNGIIPFYFFIVEMWLLLFSRLLMYDSATPWTAACQASLTITTSQSLFKLMYIGLMISSNHLILCCPLLLLPSIFPSLRVFSKESALGIRWPKYGNFSFSISPFSEYSGLISFRIDWFDLTYFMAKNQNIKQKQYCNNLKTLKNGPHKKFFKK